MQISSSYIQSGAADWVKKSAADEFNIKKEQVKKEGQKSSAGAAKVEISANSGNSAQALVKAGANALPEVRENKVAVAKERIESGFYNTEEFSNELAKSLAEG